MFAGYPPAARIGNKKKLYGRHPAQPAKRFNTFCVVMAIRVRPRHFQNISRLVIMRKPAVCPVCGRAEIQQQSVKNTLVATNISVRLITYKCSEGHVFLIEVDNAKTAGKANG